VVSRLMWKMERRSSGSDRSLGAADDLAEPRRGGISRYGLDHDRRSWGL
jgi:hypothetical protein